MHVAACTCALRQASDALTLTLTLTLSLPLTPTLTLSLPLTPTLTRYAVTRGGVDRGVLREA